MLELRNKLAVFQKLDEIKREKEETRKQIEEMNAELSAKLEENSGIAAKLAEVEEKLNIRSRGLHQLEGKQEALLSLLNRSVRSLMLAKKNKKLKGIHGIVSELGKSSEEYALPLRVAAGNHANAVVVDDIDVAKDCLEFLRDNRIGTATLLPLDKIKAIKTEQKPIEHPGFIGYAIELIKFKPQYENVFRLIFKDTIIVKDIESAKEIGINKYRMVTIGGDLFERSGFVHGGFRTKEKSGFKEEPIEDEIERLRSEVGEIQQEISVLEPQKEKSAEYISMLRGRIYTADEKLKGFKEIDLSEAERINADLKKREEEQKVLWGEVKELPKKIAQEFLNKLNEKLKVQRDKIAVLEGDKKGYEVQIEIIGRDIERFTGLIKSLDKETKDFEKRISDNNKELTSTEGSLSKKLVEGEKFYGKLKELYAKRNKLMETTKELEIERNKIEIQIDVIRKDAQEFQLKIAEVNARIEGKLAALEEFRGIEVKAVKDTPEELARQIEDLQKMIEEYGNVNMRALEIYHDVEKQYNALKERTEKLFAEKGDVLQVMSEVEGQKKETFMQTFESIAKSFSHVFSVISIKGEGSLILENPENPFAGGVEIIAKPGGKKMVSLRSMSGGEKTLTTLAFIFAVQECSPSSFYIMDEVDAALDPENAERLGVLISEYAKDSQFIMISHNPAVIEQGDCIFGVDMNELGESRVQSIILPAK
jgi:chromosome segregation protein